MGEGRVRGELEMCRVKDVEGEEEEEEEDSNYYVTLVTDQGERTLMETTDSGCLTLHTFDSMYISPMYNAGEYRSELCKRLGIDADMHFVCVVEELLVNLVILEVTTRECSVSAPYVWVEWREACNEFEKSCRSSGVAALLRNFLLQRGIETVRRKRIPWYSLGYYDHVFPWIERAVGTAGHRMIDKPEPYQFSPRSMLLTIATECGRLFFKASWRGSGEALRTKKICQLFPHHTPKLAQVSSELEMTLTYDLGPTLGRTCFVPLLRKPAPGYEDTIAIAESALKQWASFQQISVSHVEKLIDSGLPMRAADWIQNGFEDILSYVKENGCLSLREQERLRACKSHLERTFDLWEKSGIPRTLVHGDLDERNIAQPNGPGTAFVFFDWDFAFIGFPFLDLGDSEVTSLFKGESAYCEAWSHFADSETIRKLAAWSKPLAILVFAIVEMRKSYMWTEDERKDVVASHVKDFLESVHKLAGR